MSVHWLDFNRVNPYLPDQFESLNGPLMEAFDELRQSGATRVLVPNITIHQALDRLEIGLPLIHALDMESVEEPPVVPNGRALVLGTPYTMQSGYLAAALQRVGLRPEAPEPAEQQWLDEVRNRVYAGLRLDNDRDQLAHFIVRASADCLPVIACTELSILVGRLRLPGINLALAQIHRAVSWATGT